MGEEAAKAHRRLLNRRKLVSDFSSRHQNSRLIAKIRSKQIIVGRTHGRLFIYLRCLLMDGWMARELVTLLQHPKVIIANNHNHNNNIMDPELGGWRMMRTTSTVQNVQSTSIGGYWVN